MSTNIKAKKFKVVIMGAGGAGLAAGMELLENGFKDFVILEARNRIGGRVVGSSEFGDLGAAWLHIPHELINDKNSDPKEVAAIIQDVEELGLLKFATRKGFTLVKEEERITPFYNSDRVSEQRFYNEINRMQRRIDSKLTQLGNPRINKKNVQDTSLANVLRGLTQKSPFRKFIAETEFGGAEHGVENKDVSIQDLGDVFLRNEGLLVKEGLAKLIYEFTKPVHSHVLLNHEIDGFQVFDGLVSISGIDRSTGEKFTFGAERAIMTLPIGVLKCKEKGHEIAHNLSAEKIAAIDKIKMGTFNKVILRMREDFFKKFDIEENSQIHSHHDKIKHDFAMLARPAGKPLIVAFVGGQESLEFEQKGEEYAINTVLNSLTSAYGIDVRSYFERGHLTRWNEDQYSRGAYTVTEIGYAGARKVLNKPERDTLWVAGEANYSGGWQTHLIGAMISGQIAAEEVFKSLSKERKLG